MSTAVHPSITTRNRTLVFIQFRNEKRSTRSHSFSSHEPNSVSMSLLGKGSKDEEIHDAENPSASKPKIPPAWMSLIDDINYDVSKIKEKLNKLSEFHKIHLLPQFGEDPMNEQTIEILTDEITKLFHQAQRTIKRIGEFKVKSAEEKKMQKNVQSTLASQLQTLSGDFRKTQRDYLSKLRGRESKGRTTHVDEEEGPDETFDVAFTNTQMSAVMQAQQDMTQRQQDVMQILSSIKELTQIFNDLALLVNEQGTVLDRIDHNMDTVQVNVTKGIKELKDATTYQKKYGKKLMMLLLCIGVLVMVVVVIMKGLIK